MDHCKRTAFTLIELLVVISIIALLIAILLPALGAARASARAAVCMAQVRSIGMVNAMYADEYDGMYAPAHISGPSPLNRPGWGVYWFDNNGIREMLNIPTLGDLSSTPWTGYNSSGERVSGMWPTKFLCPDADWALADASGFNPVEGYAAVSETYGINMSSEKAYMPGHGVYTSANPGLAATKQDWVKQPSSVIQFLDGRKRYNPHGGHDTQVYTPGGFAWYDGEGQAYSAWGSVYAWRHPNWSASIVYYDGHAAVNARDSVIAQDSSDEARIAEIWDTQMDHWSF